MLAKNLQDDVRQYCREVESLLICAPKTRQTFTEEFQSDVQAYISENGDDVSADELWAYFGAPEDIAKGFLDSLSSKAVKRAIDWKKVLLTGIGIALFLLALYIVISLIDGHLAASGFRGNDLTDHGNIK